MIKNQLTVIIKTFERQKLLIKLLNSINKSQLKECEIVIADDSKNSRNNKENIISKFPKLKIDYVVLPFDSGLSHGRNACLERVKTKYFLLLDDDFLINEHVDFISIIEKDLNGVDILTGYLENYALLRKEDFNKELYDRLKRLYQKILKKPAIQNYIGYIDLSNKKQWVVTYYFNDYKDKQIDIGFNFFIADTEKIKSMGGWTNQLKIGEHLEFFVRCKKRNLIVKFSKKMSVKHFPERNVDYDKYRERGVEFFKVLLNIHNIDKIISYYPDDNMKKTMMLDSNGEFKLIEEREYLN